MPSDQKKCNKCLQVKSLEDFHRDKCGTLGRKSFCKACANANSKAWCDANPEKVREMQASWKERNPGKAAEATRRWQAENAERIRAVSYAYRKRNATKLLGQHHIWKAKHPKRYAELLRKSKAKNSEKAKQQRAVRDALNRDALLEYGRNYQKTHRVQGAINSSQRRAKKFQATPAWADEFIISEIYELAKLRSKMLGIPFEVDHMVPLRSNLVCGLHVEHNLQVITKFENMSKKNRYWPDMPELITGR